MLAKEEEMFKIVLYFGFLDDSKREKYPRYREPDNIEIYQTVQNGQFVNMTGPTDIHRSTLPIQAEVKKILNDEEKNSRSIYLLAASMKDYFTIVEIDSRWEEVLEGNP